MNELDPQNHTWGSSSFLPLAPLKLRDLVDMRHYSRNRINSSSSSLWVVFNFPSLSGSQVVIFRSPFLSRLVGVVLSGSLVLIFRTICFARSILAFLIASSISKLQSGVRDPRTSISDFLALVRFSKVIAPSLIV